ncbi:hypothetical protein C482_19531 [Natrialba chahannaoensis JCM 10990]|uniref:DUF2795 domain-containing protein n=1 Tax=Natrialba chahannaoensis JCM 10990 TaxID=1227492 RepID=M0A785_9EURY|nr:hypothetical protein [Natrialba chahannaoensis]ELY93198.1 hypothetical protein C482_19531 [Natrialba chahannaoensis JCM 10990]
MDRTLKLNELESTFEELEYPVTKAEAAGAFEATTLVLADGERNLGSLLGETQEERYESAGELEAALHNALPREAVGEPFQSEGEG